MYYLVTIGYEQENEKGTTKVKKEKYVIEAESVEEVTIVAANYKSTDSRDSESISIVKMAIECVINKETNPQYYKTR